MDFNKITIADLFSLESDGISIKPASNSLVFYVTYQRDNSLTICNDKIWTTGYLTSKQLNTIVEFINKFE